LLTAIQSTSAISAAQLLLKSARESAFRCENTASSQLVQCVFDGASAGADISIRSGLLKILRHHACKITQRSLETLSESDVVHFLSETEKRDLNARHRWRRSMMV
jgi:hypothetical protein